MTVEEMIRELSNAEGFYNYVTIIDENGNKHDDFEIWIDNNEVFIKIKG